MDLIYKKQSIPSMPTHFAEANHEERQFSLDHLEQTASQRSNTRRTTNLGLTMGCLHTVLEGPDLNNRLAHSPYGPFLEEVTAKSALQINFIEDSQLHQHRDDLAFFTQDALCFFLAPRFHLVLDTSLWQAWVYTPELEYVPIDQAIRLCVLFYGSHHNCFFVHGCGVDYRNKGFLFTGRSGVGKTTLANSSDRFKVLNDEMVLVDCSGSFPQFGGTPFRGGSLKSIMHKGMVTAAGTLFLIQSPRDKLRNLSIVKAITTLGQTVFQLHGCPDYMERTLDIIADFCEQVPAFDMEYTLGNRFLGLLNQQFFNNAAPNEHG